MKAGVKSTSPSRAVRNRRLRLAQAEWRFQDRNRGNYVTTRNGRPYAPRVKRERQQLMETLFAVGAVILLWLVLVATA